MTQAKTHKHAAAIKAWADGAEIEYFSRGPGKWCTTSDPMWTLETEYRVKPKPDKFAELKAAYARGEKIQVRDPRGDLWLDTEPMWLSGFEYRIKPNPHAELKAAYELGEKIEFRNRTTNGKWYPAAHPSWSDDTEYRIAKPRYRFRLYWRMPADSIGNPALSLVTEEQERCASRETFPGFIRWEGGWQEVTQP